MHPRRLMRRGTRSSSNFRLRSGSAGLAARKLQVQTLNFGCPSVPSGSLAAILRLGLAKMRSQFVASQPFAKPQSGSELLQAVTAGAPGRTFRESCGKPDRRQGLAEADRDARVAQSQFRPPVQYMCRSILSSRRMVVAISSIDFAVELIHRMPSRRMSISACSTSWRQLARSA